MVQTQTRVNVVDNTGVKQIMCISLLGNGRKKGYIGDIFVGCVKVVNPDSQIKKGDIVLAVIVRMTTMLRRSNGVGIRFSENACALITKEKNPRGTRIFGPVPRELKDKNFIKLISISEEVI